LKGRPVNIRVKRRGRAIQALLKKPVTDWLSDSEEKKAPRHQFKVKETFDKFLISTRQKKKQHKNGRKACGLKFVEVKRKRGRGRARRSRIKKKTKKKGGRKGKKE